MLHASTLRRLIFVGGVLSIALPARAQLAARSPFLPQQSAAPSAPTAGAPLEYRGYLETAKGVQYRLYNPTKKIGTWVKLNEPNSELGVVAKQYDANAGTLVIEHDGKTMTLAERKPKVVSSGNAAHAMPPPVTPVMTNVPPAVTQAVVLNPTPADEQRRLDAVAAEVARRRALREQAAQQAQGGAVQAAVPTVQPAQNLQAVPPGGIQPNMQYGPRNRNIDPTNTRRR
jgi:hypothetical protein